MKTVVPSYYKNFKCIADKCRHSCCVGWEIDIDPATMEYYSGLDGEIGSTLKANISQGKEPHFILKEGDRCPFLKENGLCHLICELGEQALCNICADHPRFRNFFSGGVEMGLGLCCEAAAELILKSDAPFTLLMQDDIYLEAEEIYFKNKRDKLVSIMEKPVSLNEKFTELSDEAGSSFALGSLTEWVDFFLSLERLDHNWTMVLSKLSVKDFAPVDEKAHSAYLKNLATYFIYRHLPSMLYDGELSAKVKFAVLATMFIHTLAVNFGDNYVDSLCEFSRMFSSEIEYSDENLEAVFNELLW